MSHKLDADKIIDETPAAHGAGIFICPSPDCGRPHLVLFDENNKPLLQWVVPEEKQNGKSFLMDLEAALYKSAVEKK